MRRRILSILLIAMLLIGCAQKPDLTAQNVPDSEVTILETQLSQEDSVTEPKTSTVSEDTMTDITITIGPQTFSAVLYDNPTANAFAELLPMTICMEELNGNEKYHYLREGLPVNPEVPNMIHSGDLMLFGSECVVLFYEDLSTAYSYTPLGYIEIPEGLKEALGSGDITVTFQV